MGGLHFARETGGIILMICAAQLAHPLLVASGDACIVMNSSVAGGPMAIKTGAIYAMSKGAWRLELSSRRRGRFSGEMGHL